MEGTACRRSLWTAGKTTTAKPAQSPAASPSVTATPTATKPAKAQSSPTQPASSPTPTQPASPAPKPTQPASPSPTPPAAGSSSCANPVFTSGDQFGTYTSPPYHVANNMWNAGGANATQTLSVCSPSSWYVTANSAFTSGTVDLLDFFQYLISQGWIASTSTLVEVDYGVEVVNTNGAAERFGFGNFSVDAS